MKPCRIHVTGGQLRGRHVVVMAPDEWAAMSILSKALNDQQAVYTWPVFEAPGTPDLFGAPAAPETITLSEALEALKADAR